MYLKNVIKHFGLITHHKWVVFKLCCKIGEPWRGLVHDMSKYSPTEFIESSKYITLENILLLVKLKEKMDILRLGYIIREGINIIANIG